jgi:hypothetical protein
LLTRIQTVKEGHGHVNNNEVRSQFNRSPNQGAPIAHRANNFVVSFEKFLAGLGYQGVVVRDKDAWEISPDHNPYSYQKHYSLRRIDFHGWIPVRQTRLQRQAFLGRNLKVLLDHNSSVQPFPKRRHQPITALSIPPLVFLLVNTPALVKHGTDALSLLTEEGSRANAVQISLSWSEKGVGRADVGQ